MVQEDIARLIVEVAKEIGADPDTVVVREATSCGATKAGMPRLLRHAAGKTAFLYCLSRDTDLITWLTEHGWSHRPFDNGDIFWKGC